MNNKDFHTGADVWVAERDEDGDISDVTGYVFIAKVLGYAIVSATIDESSDVEDIMQDNVQSTLFVGSGDLAVFPISDCYYTKEDADNAMNNDLSD